MGRGNLARLLSPRSIAVIGGREAEEVIRQCDAIGYAGAIYPVHPSRAQMGGRDCFRSVTDLPEAPDAAFIAVPREAAVEAVAALAAIGAGGAACYASGFAEVGVEGAALEARLVAASGAMALTGPNCYGHLNYLDGAALWPDRHGGRRVARGVAIVTQSGNIGLNLTMQRRALPLAMLVTVGNKAKGDLGDYVEAFLDDPRITAIGLHVEAISDVAGLSRAAERARTRGVPIVALKTGRSQAGAAIAFSHTASLAGSDAAYGAFFERHGIGRAHDLATFVEALKLLHVHGPLPGRRISSMSCSGGEASLMADLAQDCGLETPQPDAAMRAALGAALGPQVALANPLDYHTYIWGDLAGQARCFSAMLAGPHDINCLVLDFPRDTQGIEPAWAVALDALAAAQRATGARAAVVASLPESLPEEIGEALVARGIAPLQGMGEALAAIAISAAVGAIWARDPPPPLAACAAHEAKARTLDEAQSKAALVEFGVPVPRAIACALDGVAAAAATLGCPVVVKALGAGIAHKSELGAVRLDLATPEAAQQAARGMARLSSRFLVEEMLQGAVAELIVGVTREPPFGIALTIGAGGIFVDLLRDSATLLLPASRADIAAALDSLRVAKVLGGLRGRPAGDVEASLDAIEAIARFALAHADTLAELDVNPLLVLPQGAAAADALVQMSDAQISDAEAAP